MQRTIEQELAEKEKEAKLEEKAAEEAAAIAAANVLPNLRTEGFGARHRSKSVSATPGTRKFVREELSEVPQTARKRSKSVVSTKSLDAPVRSEKDLTIPQPFKFSTDVRMGRKSEVKSQPKTPGRPVARSVSSARTPGFRRNAEGTSKTPGRPTARSVSSVRTPGFRGNGGTASRSHTPGPAKTNQPVSHTPRPILKRSHTPLPKKTVQEAKTPGLQRTQTKAHVTNTPAGSKVTKPKEFNFSSRKPRKS
jgi:hypothetical protein